MNSTTKQMLANVKRRIEIQSQKEAEIDEQVEIFKQQLINKTNGHFKNNCTEV